VAYNNNKPAIRHVSFTIILGVLLLLSACGGGESTTTDTPPPAPDSQAPSVPQGLTVTATNGGQVNLSWTATSAIDHQVSNTKVRVPGFRLNAHFNADMRNGQASGTVSDGSTNFTPIVSTDGLLQSSSAGQVQITPQ